MCFLIYSFISFVVGGFELSPSKVTTVCSFISFVVGGFELRPSKATTKMGTVLTLPLTILRRGSHICNAKPANTRGSHICNQNQPTQFAIGPDWWGWVVLVFGKLIWLMAASVSQKIRNCQPAELKSEMYCNARMPLRSSTVAHGREGHGKPNEYLKGGVYEPSAYIC